MPYQVPGGRRVRKVEEVKAVPRGPARSLWRTAKEEAVVAGARPPAVEAADRRAAVTAAPPPLEPAPAAPLPRRIRKQIVFFRDAILNWAKEYINHIREGRLPFRTYPAGHTGIYRLPRDLTVAIASDWGTGTESAYRVADQMVKAAPDVTIHLGDVYYSGTEEEYRNYFMAPNCWPSGKLQPQSGGDARGTYVLNANHEMYSGGRGYFNVALRGFQQEASYFCLENEHWRIVALDTGYHCTRGLKKIFSFIFGDKTRLHDATVSWLAREVFRDPADRRPVILLSHHQWFSAFDDRDYPTIGEQLQPYLDRVALWFWGHEHRFAGYAPYAPKGPKVRARCIGHGGMPIELGWKRTKMEAAVFSDQRSTGRAVGSKKLGYCGFARLDFRAERLTVTYVDENGVELVEETWTRQGGALQGSARLLRELPQLPGFEMYRPIGDLAL